MSESLYDVLAVSRSATTSEIRSAYRQLARALHPDRAGGSAAAMAELNEAWSVLSDPARRRAYDRGLAALGRRNHGYIGLVPPVRGRLLALLGAALLVGLARFAVFPVTFGGPSPASSDREPLTTTTVAPVPGTSVAPGPSVVPSTTTTTLTSTATVPPPPTTLTPAPPTTVAPAPPPVPPTIPVDVCDLADLPCPPLFPLR